jgi:hypothetical protein
MVVNRLLLLHVVVEAGSLELLVYPNDVRLKAKGVIDSEHWRVRACVDRADAVGKLEGGKIVCVTRRQGVKRLNGVHKHSFQTSNC